MINTPPRPSDTHGFWTQAADSLRAPAGTRALITSDHDTIQRWAARHSAVAATGEATVSGPATMAVNDGGAGIRLNFPGAGFFRPITWDEWFDNFEAHHLAFAVDEEVADARMPSGKSMAVDTGVTAVIGSKPSANLAAGCRSGRSIPADQTRQRGLNVRTSSRLERIV